MVADDDFVKGYLINELDKYLCSLDIFFLETDLSAYSPRVQKTFYELGYRPIVYAPAMVFQDTERLDIVRFAKINGPFDLGDIQILDEERTKAIYELVSKEFK